MSTIILNVLKKVPVPIFGSAAYAVQFGMRKSNLLPRLAPWGVPLGIGALWFVWPAVDDEWKGEMGFVGPEIKVTVKIEEKIYKMSALEKQVVEAMKEGDYSYLEKDWENFQNKASNPNDDDDDEDEDEDDGDDDDGDGDDGDDDGGSDDLAAGEDEDEDEDDDEADAVAEAAKAARVSAEEERVLENIRKGDFSSLEADWDAFQIKASNPNDDDDDDDDEDEEEEEEEEEGGDGDGDGAEDEEEEDDDE